LVFHSSTIAMMHGPINIRCGKGLECRSNIPELAWSDRRQPRKHVGISGVTTEYRTGHLHSKHETTRRFRQYARQQLIENP